MFGCCRVSHYHENVQSPLNVCLSGPSEAGGLGGLQPPNDLLKFVDFETEKGCKSQRLQE